MSAFDIKCPKCGDQSIECEEDQWLCLHCGNKFVYKEQSPGGPSEIHKDEADQKESDTDLSDISDDSKTPGQTPPDSIDLSSGIEEHVELFLEDEGRGPDGDGAKLDIDSFLDDSKSDDDPRLFNKTTEPSASYNTGDEAFSDITDLDEEDDFDFDPLHDTNFDDHEDNGPQRPLHGQGKKISLIIVTIVIAVGIWIASYSEKDVRVPKLLQTDLDLVTENKPIVGNKPDKPVPEPRQPTPAADLSAEQKYQLYQQALPATVLVIAWKTAAKERAKQGSGFFVDDGKVLTNFHVVEHTWGGYVESLGTKEQYKFTVLNKDKGRDLAILSVTSSSEVRPLKIGNSDLVKTTDPIFVLSNPKGLSDTWTEGVVSARRRLPNLGNIECIQIDILVAKGSSGAPVFSTKGEVIGVVTQSAGFEEQLNFAVPSKYIKLLLNRP